MYYKVANKVPDVMRSLYAIWILYVASIISAKYGLTCLLYNTDLIVLSVNPIRNKLSHIRHLANKDIVVTVSLNIVQRCLFLHGKSKFSS